MEYPLWYKLITHWGRRGLTLPYIMGAIAYDTETDLIQEDVTDFLDEVANSNYPSKVLVTFCPDLQETIFGLTGRNTPYSVTLNIGTGLVIGASIQNDAKTLDELITHCINDYWSYIRDGEFTKEKGKFVAFKESDYTFIKEAQALEMQ